MLAYAGKIGGGSCCTIVLLVILITLLALAGGIFNIVGLVYACLSLNEVTDPHARICHITIIVAYASGIVSTLFLTTTSKNEPNNWKALLCNAIASIFTLYVLAIFIYAQFMYFNEDRHTYCSGNECSRKYYIGVLGFIISNYVYLGVVLLIVILMLVFCCVSKIRR